MSGAREPQLTSRHGLYRAGQSQWEPFFDK